MFFSSMEGIYTCFLPRKLGLDVVNNLVTFAICRARIHSNPTNYYVYPRLLRIVFQSIGLIHMKEVPCTLQKNLLFYLFQTLPPQNFILSIASQSMERILMEEAAGALRRSFQLAMP